MSGRVRRVLVFTTDSGGGHRATSNALRDILQARSGWEVTIVNAYTDLLRPFDWAERYTGYTCEDVYNNVIIGRRMTGLTCYALYAIGTLNVNAYPKSGQRAFEGAIKAHRPDLVVSTMPLVNRAIARACAMTKTPLAILMTELKEYVKNLWFPISEAHPFVAICGTEVVADALRAARFPDARIEELDGVLIRPEFLRPSPSERAAAKQALGFDANRPVVCVFYGSGGGGRVGALTERLIAADLPIQILALCGRDEASAAHLRGLQTAVPLVVEGFVDDVPRYLRAADIFVGKPGPGSVSEALAMGLSLLIDRRDILIQERCVVPWLAQHGFGCTFNSERGFIRELTQLLNTHDPNAVRPVNRSADQIEPILAKIINGPL